MLSISINFAGHTHQKNLNLNETESFTNESWQELFDANQGNNIPYFVIGATLVGLANKTESHLYDGVQLRKRIYNCIDQNIQPLDPLTSLPIRDVHFIFFRCFKLGSDVVQRCPMHIAEDEDEFICVDQEFLFSSLNRLADEEPNLSGRVTKLQYIVGHSLINNGKSAGLIWLGCAAKRGDDKAIKYFSNPNSPCK